MSPNRDGRESDVRECYARIVASRSFIDSPFLCSFLKYIIDLSLTGRSAEIKEYAIGVDVFHRGSEFNPRSDPIVRVQARRLRQKLAEYYERQEVPDPVRIDVPKGSYIPVFQFPDSQTAAGGVVASNTSALPIGSELSVPRMGPGVSFLTPGRRLIVLSLALLVALTWVVSGLLTRRNGHASHTSGYRQLQRLTHDYAVMPALSPDGRLLAYSSDRAGEGNIDVWVQPVSGGEAVRLTRLPHQEWTPSFSPDGTSVFFWYSSVGGELPDEGLYTVPIIGGGRQPRKIVSGMAGNPRISPDGKWIAYTGGTKEHMVLSVVAASGGSPKQLTSEFVQSGFPAWLPDNRHIIFLGTQTGSDHLLKRQDWWVVSLDGGAPVRTGAVQQFLSHAIIEEGKATGDFWPSAWFDGRIIFRAGRGDDSQHIWSIPLNLKTFRVEGLPRQETFGGAREVLPAVSNDGTLVFVGQTISRDFWAVSLDANSGRLISGDLQKITRNSGSDGVGLFSRDGSSLVFNTIRNNGNHDIYRILLNELDEKVVIASPWPEFVVGLSSDASRILYAAQEDGVAVLYAGSAEAGTPQKVCRECRGVITPDGSRIYYSESREGQDANDVFVRDLLSRKSSLAFTVEKEICFPCPISRFSWDGRWVATLRGAGRAANIALFPVPDAASMPNRTPVLIAGEGDGMARWAIAGSLVDWSPDGNLVYFASDRDGHRCVWAQRVHATSKMPLGAAFPVYHNHARNSSGLSTMMVLKDRLAMGLPTGTSEIWLTKLK